MNVSKYCADPKNSQGPQTTSEYGPDLDHNSPNSPKRHRFNRPLVWILISVAAVLIVVSLVLVLPMINKSAQHSALICVPKNASQKQIEDSLAKYFGPEFARDTRRAMVVISGQDDEMRHGAWLIEEGMTPFRAARVLMKGGQTPVQVTLNNQRTPEDVAELFASKLEFSKEDFMKALHDDHMLKKYDTDPDHALVLFLKDTYDFYWTDKPEDVVKRMRENYRKFWTPERRNIADNLRVSPRDMVTLASIVDAETNDEAEKGTIGRLYINRLDEGMKLQSDPTVIYAIGDFSITRVSQKMLQTDSPFNTYKHAGLPPGPIRLTSTATIEKILQAQPNDYLYMCADEQLNGTHKFAITYEEHLENARRYQEALDKKGISLSQQ